MIEEPFVFGSNQLGRGAEEAAIARGARLLPAQALRLLAPPPPPTLRHA